MIQFNAQWLCCPFLLWAAYKFCIAVSAVVTTWDKPDIGRLLGIGAAIQCVVHIVASLGLAFLIWKGFR